MYLGKTSKRIKNFYHEKFKHMKNLSKHIYKNVTIYKSKSFFHKKGYIHLYAGLAFDITYT